MNLRTLLLGLILCLPPFVAGADDAIPAEIDFLLESIGSSNCTFIRNGKHYDSATAEDHLRMKYRKGKRYTSTSEEFIERLASKSFLSRKLYFIECDGDEKTSSGDWLKERLQEYRAAS